MGTGEMHDRFDRRIHYLRVSVTDRCNLRCRYCMPTEGITLIPRDRILRFEEIADLVRVAVSMGIDKVRLTGGEPLVRRGIVTLVSMLAAIDGIVDLAMTTNGILLDQFARPLADAGMRRVNVSLDAIDPARFAERTGGGDVRRVLEGIAAARRAGLTPVKLNCVVARSREEEDAQQVARFAGENGLEVRFIREMNLARGSFSVVEGGAGGDCAHCNRLRLSSDGLIRPCLFNDLAFDVRALGPRAAIERAVEHKPEKGLRSRNNRFHAIGG